MSTYLVAMAVLEGYDFARRVSRNTDRPIEVRIYAPKDVLKGQENFGLDTAIKAIEFFEDYFNISYPLEKIGRNLFFSGISSSRSPGSRGLQRRSDGELGFGHLP